MAVAETQKREALLGLRMNEEARRLGLTPPQLAKASGVVLSIVQRIGHGQGKRVSAWSVVALADTLGVTTDYLLGRTAVRTLPTS